MSSEQLRQTVVQTALPLLGEYETWTMAGIAEAAGIGEDELRTVFADREAVLHACTSVLLARMTTVMDPAGAIREMGAIRVDQPVASRLLEVIGVLNAYYDRVHADMAEFERSGFAGADTSGAHLERSADRQEFRTLGSQVEVQHAVARLLRPEEQRLPLPAEAVAEIFLAMSHTCTGPANGERTPLPADRVVEIFLHGALTAE